MRDDGEGKAWSGGGTVQGERTCKLTIDGQGPTRSETERRQGRPRTIRRRLLALVELTVEQSAIARVESACSDGTAGILAAWRWARRECDRPEHGRVSRRMRRGIGPACG
jgi:hypothetical protein